MKARELRIGNLVTDEFYDHFKTVHKVESINEKGINLEVTDDGDWPEVASHWIEPECSFDKLRGIPLTEEWLKRLGFVFHDLENFEETDPKPYESYRLFLNEKRIQFIYVDITPRNQFDVGLGDIDMTDQSEHFYVGDFKYVHQLQNLYYALTGEELSA